MSWSPQTVQSGSVPLHHTPMTFSMTFTGRGTHTISFSYCNNPTTRSNVCCDQLSLSPIPNLSNHVHFVGVFLYDITS